MLYKYSFALHYNPLILFTLYLCLSLPLSPFVPHNSLFLSPSPLSSSPSHPTSHAALDDQNNLIPCQELDNLVSRALHRLLEYNAVTTTLQQARQHSRLHLSNNSSKEDSHNMTLNGTPVTSLSVRDFRQLLTEHTQPCSVNFWKKRFDTEIDNRYWEVAFNANQETRLKVL